MQSDDPIISNPSTEWKKDKCDLLRIQFESDIEQHMRLNGEKIKWFQPWKCEDIKSDGNCLFRCFSKIVTGTEKHHLKIRGEICRYMITTGRDTMGWYFNQVHSNTPAQYLRMSGMVMEVIWGSGIELMAFSSILKTNICICR